MLSCAYRASSFFSLIKQKKFLFTRSRANRGFRWSTQMVRSTNPEGRTTQLKKLDCRTHWLGPLSQSNNTGKKAKTERRESEDPDPDRQPLPLPTDLHQPLIVRRPRVSGQRKLTSTPAQDSLLSAPCARFRAAPGIPIRGQMHGSGKKIFVEKT